MKNVIAILILASFGLGGYLYFKDTTATALRPDHSDIPSVSYTSAPRIDDREHKNSESLVTATFKPKQVSFLQLAEDPTFDDWSFYGSGAFSDEDREQYDRFHIEPYNPFVD